MTLKEMQKFIKELGTWIEWERESLDDFHAFAHRFGGSPGSNVFQFALKEALAHHGMTLKQFRAERLEAERQGKGERS